VLLHERDGRERRRDHVLALRLLVQLARLPGIHCCQDDDDLAKAVRHMEALKIRRLPV
jgi:hypothetical protein